MIRIKWSLSLLVAWMASSSAHGETWADWLTPPKDSSVVAAFQPGWNVEWISQESVKRTKEAIEPNRGYEGELVFSAAPGMEIPAGTLTVRLLYSVAKPEEIQWSSARIPSVISQAVVHRAVSEETHRVPAEFPLRIPVVLPLSCSSPISWRNNDSPALFGRYELLSDSGQTVCRGVLPARRLAENSRMLVGKDENDEAMKGLTERGGSIDRVGDLPNAMVAYRQVRGIWFTESLWKNMEGRESLLRRLLLSGVQMSGKTSLVLRIQAALGTGSKGQVLSASVLPESWNSQNKVNLRKLNLQSVEIEGRKRKEPEKSVLENNANLFAAKRKPYLMWSAAGLLVFCIGVGVILGLVFIRHKGERRVAIWWTLPAWTLFCCVAIWAGGLLVLDRRPSVDVTEYRLLLSGWPEMHCRVVASAMTFTSDRPVWTLPSEAVVISERTEPLDGWWAREDKTVAADGIHLQLPRKPTGTTLQLEAGWFEPAAAPVSLENGTVDEPGRWVVASEDVDGVFVFAKGDWYELGPMKAGDRRDPLTLKKRADNRLPGLPESIHDNCVRRKKPDWIIVALKKEMPPRGIPMWTNSLTKGRVIWVMQCP